MNSIVYTSEINATTTAETTSDIKQNTENTIQTNPENIINFAMIFLFLTCSLVVKITSLTSNPLQVNTQGGAIIEKGTDLFSGQAK
ncbi:hypothetical protein [Pseudomonas sp. PMCC200344]|uniref:hypothetical protein n=1 Tax=Pseudomonas sp. PMCC200344 TaxID=3042028 RepID=UPI0024B37B76|nr:hypothetical protein [Pseudomonas sp. PMCC200344]